MIIDELRVATIEARRAHEESGADQTPAKVALIIPRVQRPRGLRVYLAGDRGPLGEIMSTRSVAMIRGTNYQGFEVTARFDCAQVLAFLDREEAEVVPRGRYY